MIDRLTCGLCPVSCELEARRHGGDLEIRGNQCEKGVDFAREEILHPKRNLATSVPLAGTDSRMVSVRLSAPVPRTMMGPVLAEISRLRPRSPIRRGDILLRDVSGTGADVIATRTLLD